MKKITCIILIVVLAVAVLSCGQNTVDRQTETAEQTQPEQTPVPSATPAGPSVALVMDGENEFNTELNRRVEEYAAAAGFRLLSFFSADASAQVTDIYTAIGDGTSAIILMPIDMDNLQVVIEETAAQKVPVINALYLVNGTVETLISPNYQTLGELAAETIYDMKPDAAVLTVEQVGTATVAQMIHDGFARKVRELETIIIEKSIIVDAQGKSVYDSVLEALHANEKIDTMFVQDEIFAAEAVRAALDIGRDLIIVTHGGGAGIMGMIETGTIDASIFASPNELAKIAAEFVANATNGTAAIPQFAELRLEIITPDNVASYRQSGEYADYILPPPPEPTPVPEETPEGESGAEEEETGNTETQPENTDQTQQEET